MPQTDDRLWFTRLQSAALCGLSPRQFDEAIRPRIKDGERGTGRTLRFNGPASVAALLDYRAQQIRPATTDEADPLLVGVGSSPALERYRLARAKSAELDLAERDASLVRLRVLQEAMRPAIAAMRGTGARLVRQFGNEAGDIFNEGVDEFAAAAIKTIEKTDAIAGAGVNDNKQLASGHEDAQAANTQ